MPIEDCSTSQFVVDVVWFLISLESMPKRFLLGKYIDLCVFVSVCWDKEIKQNGSNINLGGSIEQCAYEKRGKVVWSICKKKKKNKIQFLIQIDGND